MKHIKDEDKYDEIENILDELKMAVIYNNKELVEKFDDELTDILFEDQKLEYDNFMINFNKNNYNYIITRETE